MSLDLERLYQDAKAALAVKDYDRAGDLLRQILKADVDYKDAAQLLARAIRLSRRRWHSDPRLWGALGALLLVGLGIFIFPKLQGRYNQPVMTPVIISTNTLAPKIVPSATVTSTTAPLPTPTPIPLAWKRISLGVDFARDTVAALVIDPNDSEVLYAGMKNAGIYKSIDGGLSWRPTHHGLTNAHVISLLIDFQSPQILYAGTLDGIFKIEDGGENWLKFFEGYSVLMDPQDSSHLFARDDYNIYESTDRGENWAEVYSTKESCPDAIRTWAIHPVDGKTLFVVGGEECEQGLFLSSDGGKTWALEENRNLCIASLSVGVDEQGNYFAIDTCEVEYSYYLPLPTLESVYSYWDADRHLYKESLNGGKRLTLGKPDVGFVRVIAISPGDPDTLYAAGEDIAVSRDGGLTWMKLNNGFGNTVLQLDTGDKDSLYLLSGNCQEDWSSLERDNRQALFYSPNGGETWNLAGQSGCYLIKDADEVTLYRVSSAMTWREDTGIYWIWYTKDGGKSWGRESAPPYTTIVADPVQSGLLRLYLNVPPYDWGGYQQYISVDYGNTWKANSPESSVKPCYGSTLQFIDAYRPMAIDPSDGNHVLFIDSGTLFESYDSCETMMVFATAPNTNMNSIAFDSKNTGTLYAGTDEGAYISFDAGGTWHQINDGLLGATVVYSVIVDKEGNVYATTPYGIFKLEEN